MSTINIEKLHELAEKYGISKEEVECVYRSNTKIGKGSYLDDSDLERILEGCEPDEFLREGKYFADCENLEEVKHRRTQDIARYGALQKCRSYCTYLTRTKGAFFRLADVALCNFDDNPGGHAKVNQFVPNDLADDYKAMIDDLLEVFEKYKRKTIERRKGNE